MSAAAGNNNSKINFSEMMSGNSGYKVIKIQLPSSIYDSWVKQKKGQVLGKITLDKPLKDIGEEQERNSGTLNCSCTEAKCSISLDPIRDNNLIVFNENNNNNEFSLEGVVTHSCRAVVTEKPIASKRSGGAAVIGRGSFAASVTTTKEYQKMSDKIEEERRKKNAETSERKRKLERERESRKVEPKKKVARSETMAKEEDFTDKLIKAFSSEKELTMDQIKERTKQEGRFKFKEVLERYCDNKGGKYSLKDSAKHLFASYLNYK